MRWFKKIKHRSKAGIVFHLCVHKTGSQWFRSILSDERTHRYSGLTHYAYFMSLPGQIDDRKIGERYFDEPFPENVIASPLYIGYPAYRDIPKPDSARAFFVMRDPRDILVSWYFSMKHSHPKGGRVMERRKRLNELPLEEGIELVLEQLEDRGHFEALRSWGDIPEDDTSVIVIRYEDLIGPEQFAHFQRIFRHADIAMPDKVLRTLLSDYSFKKLSGGREAGDENVESHYRKGVVGDWRNLLHKGTIARFREVTGDLVTYLGYTW